MIADAFAREPVLTEYAGLQVDQARRRFRELDEQLAVLERQEVAAHLCARKPPSGIGTGPRQEWTERALIDNELAKKMRHVPIRQLVARAGGALQALTPCFLMSPISVAQYLPPGGMKFDLLVIDEASQMRVEDAIGALSRAKQVVIVGDPKQLPPSSFFQSSGTEEDEESESEVDEPLSAESVLDCALTAFQPSRDLRWHYRSKHESLIAFSNHHFYDNRLQIFPSPEPNNAALGVKLRVVRGTFQSSINEVEAREVAESAVRFMEEQERVIVLSSMTANDIIAAENSSLGVRALKAYLQYAKDGLLEGGQTSARAPDSPFEEQVIEVLSSAGYEAVPQVGVRGFFIDIGIKHPSYPHGYLCGVECDGASYHSSRTARDRDRLREDILKRLGWRLVRIWSTDWFADPRGGRARLVAKLDEIRGALVDRDDPLRVAGE